MSVPDATLVVVFAKAPRPGEVKTRLAPVLDAEGAAGLHARLVKHALATVRAASFDVELFCAPDADDPFFHYCAARYGAALKSQTPGDLGTRMAAAAGDALQRAARMLLIGCDCPALTARHLRQADRGLREGADAAFVPCEDGGYSLIGLRRVGRRVFEDIPWGGPNVMDTTRGRLREMGWTWHELETLWDVDRPEDYRRLVASSLLDGQAATA
jgi:rSAM/selenodomain-associated transferase 1